MSFFYLILVLLDIEIEKKPKTTIIEAQNIESAINDATVNWTTKINKIPKSNVEQGMFNHNHS